MPPALEDQLSDSQLGSSSEGEKEKTKEKAGSRTRQKRKLLERRPSATRIKWDSEADSIESSDPDSKVASDAKRRAVRKDSLEEFKMPSERARHATGRRKKRYWNDEEIENLLKGVRKHGPGNWAKILSCYEFAPGRTSVDLKDKYRNLLNLQAKEEGLHQAKTRKKESESDKGPVDSEESDQEGKLCIDDQQEEEEEEEEHKDNEGEGEELPLEVDIEVPLKRVAKRSGKEKHEELKEAEEVEVPLKRQAKRRKRADGARSQSVQSAQLQTYSSTLPTSTTTTTAISSEPHRRARESTKRNELEDSD